MVSRLWFWSITYIVHSSNYISCYHYNRELVVHQSSSNRQFWLSFE